MFNPSKRKVRAVVAAGLLAMLALPWCYAGYGLPEERQSTIDAAGRAATPPAGTKGLYLRCWQYGRLVVEERDLQPAVDISAGLKLRGTDRNKQPMYLIDTGNATCLLRNVAPASP
jgi:hypothetical protein